MKFGSRAFPRSEIRQDKDKAWRQEVIAGFRVTDAPGASDTDLLIS